MKVEGAGDNAAQRIRISKAFKLELNGGTLDASYGQLRYVVGLGKALPTAAQISNGEKTFGGWYLSNTFDGDAFTSIPDYYNITNIKFYAKWIDEDEEEISE